jgi:hypothetical protein
MNRVFAALCLALTFATAAQPAESTVPRIWDDKALEDWSTPVAALGIRPGHFTAEEYYAIPGENLRTYPVYRPDREPAGYWEWLQKQKPQPLVDASKIHSHADWVKAGENAFQTVAGNLFRTSDPEKIKLYRDPKTYEGIWTQADGTLPVDRWVVTDHGLELRVTACTACHAMFRADHSVLWSAPQTALPAGFRDFTPTRLTLTPDGEPRRITAWRGFTVPWAPDERVEKLRDAQEGDALLARMLQSRIVGVVSRIHGNPYYTTKIPDMNNLQYSRYLDATGTHQLRGPEDVARYAAFVTGTDPMEFGEYKLLPAERRRIKSRFADEVLYAIGVYLMSLEPPRNPDLAPAATIERGREIFARETCTSCHTPGNYTNGKLTLAQGYIPPADHPLKADIMKRSVGTDPGLATKTRKGTGLYKIPSLRGLWYRPLLLHDGSVASLEEMFDPARLRPDHEPGGWKGPGVTKRAIPGHPFGLSLNVEDKTALLAFLRSL